MDAPRGAVQPRRGCALIRPRGFVCLEPVILFSSAISSGFSFPLGCRLSSLFPKSLLMTSLQSLLARPWQPVGYLAANCQFPHHADWQEPAFGWGRMTTLNRIGSRGSRRCNTSEPGATAPPASGIKTTALAIVGHGSGRLYSLFPLHRNGLSARCSSSRQPLT